jgi:ornithine--oxo-acid transaminase
MGRSGTMFGYEPEGILPDILTLAKGLGGGLPLGAMISIGDRVPHFTAGQHGSTFGGNPIAAKVAIAALEVVKEEQLIQNARVLGELFRREIQRIIDKNDLLVLVRGKGLLNAIVVNDSTESSTAWDICVALMHNGLLAKPTHGNIIRFAPPLTITEAQLMECIAIIEKTVLNFTKK